MQNARDSKSCAGAKKQCKAVASTALMGTLVTFAGVELTIGDIACGTNGGPLGKASAGDSCGTGTDNSSAKRLVAQSVATCGQSGTKDRNRNECFE